MTIKACPFCGNKKTLVASWTVFEHTQAEHLEYSVCCLNCGAEGPNDLGESGAVESWNLRSSDPLKLLEYVALQFPGEHLRSELRDADVIRGYLAVGKIREITRLVRSR